MARFLGFIGELGFDLDFHRQHELVTNSDCSNDALMQISRVLSLQTQNLIYIPSGSSAQSSLATVRSASKHCWPISLVKRRTHLVLSCYIPLIAPSTNFTTLTSDSEKPYVLQAWKPSSSTLNHHGPRSA